MAVHLESYRQLKSLLDNKGVMLVAVSKMQPAKAILDLYNAGQRDFGENYVQELVEKEAQLPKDIRWHFIGHLQSNKVKYIAPFVHLIHGVDSLKLLKEINKQGAKNGRTIPVLLQVHIAQESTKFGLAESELQEVLQAVQTAPMPHVEIKGLMGMASFSDNEQQVQKEFETLKQIYNRYQNVLKPFSVLSMGMSGDYERAVAAGSTLVRIGSLLFGARPYGPPQTKS